MLRLTWEMTPMDMILIMADGDSNTAELLSKLVEKNADINPCSMLGSVSTLNTLDCVGVYGLCIWNLYEKVCEEDYLKLIVLMRAVQLKIMDANDIAPNINHKDLYDKVSAKLPVFNPVGAAA